MKALHFAPNGRPSHAGFHFGNAYYEQGQPANKDMGSDAIIFAVVNRTKA
jgi:hypothetical protein